MSESTLKPVNMFNEGETVTQIISFNHTSLACLTSNGRILVPGKNFGEWFELPVPSLFTSPE